MYRKTISSVLIALLLALCLAGCSGGNDTNESMNSEEEPQAPQLVPEEPNSVEDYADFTLFKITTTDEVAATTPSKYSVGYYPTKDGNVFVDIVIDFTNKGTDSVKCDEVVSVSAVNAAGTVYNAAVYAAEEDNYSDVSKYVSIAPLETARLHCAISVPETETDLTLTLEIGGTEYTYDYSVGVPAAVERTIAVGDTIEEPDYATMVFTGIEYTDAVMPSNTSGYYRYYSPDDPSNTYLVVKFEITNYMSTAKDIEDFVGVKAVLGGKYNYNGFMVAESADKTSFNSYESIDPLNTKKLFYIVDIPKTVANGELDLTISFAGKEYTFSQN